MALRSLHAFDAPGALSALSALECERWRFTDYFDNRYVDKSGTEIGIVYRSGTEIGFVYRFENEFVELPNALGLVTWSFTKPIVQMFRMKSKTGLISARNLYTIPIFGQHLYTIAIFVHVLLLSLTWRPEIGRPSETRETKQAERLLSIRPAIYPGRVDRI